MKSRDALIRLKRFEVEERRRKVAEIKSMIGEFGQMAADLDRQIAIEQERAGITDVNHYAYPTFAKAAVQRRDNLTASASDLQAKLTAAREQVEAAIEDLKRSSSSRNATPSGCASSKHGLPSSSRLAPIFRPVAG